MSRNSIDQKPFARAARLPSLLNLLVKRSRQSAISEAAFGSAAASDPIRRFIPLPQHRLDPLVAKIQQRDLITLERNEGFMPRNSATVSKLQEITDRLLSAAGLTAGQLQIDVVELDTPNAIIFNQCNRILITKGLLRKLQSHYQDKFSEDMVAAIIAHEIGHYLLGHYDHPEQHAVQPSNRFFEKKKKAILNHVFNFFAELAADRLSLILIDRAGFQAQEAIRAFVPIYLEEKITEQERRLEAFEKALSELDDPEKIEELEMPRQMEDYFPSLASTHPPLQKRINNLHKLYLDINLPNFETPASPFSPEIKREIEAVSANEKAKAKPKTIRKTAQLNKPQELAEIIETPDLVIKQESDRYIREVREYLWDYEKHRFTLEGMDFDLADDLLAIYQRMKSKGRERLQEIAAIVLKEIIDFSGLVEQVKLGTEYGEIDPNLLAALYFDIFLPKLADNARFNAAYYYIYLAFCRLNPQLLLMSLTEEAGYDVIATVSRSSLPEEIRNDDTLLGKFFYGDDVETKEALHFSESYSYESILKTAEKEILDKELRARFLQAIASAIAENELLNMIKMLYSDHKRNPYLTRYLGPEEEKTYETLEVVNPLALFVTLIIAKLIRQKTMPFPNLHSIGKRVGANKSLTSEPKSLIELLVNSPREVSRSDLSATASTLRVLSDFKAFWQEIPNLFLRRMEEEPKYQLLFQLAGINLFSVIHEVISQALNQLPLVERLSLIRQLQEYEKEQNFWFGTIFNNNLINQVLTKMKDEPITQGEVEALEAIIKTAIETMEQCPEVGYLHRGLFKLGLLLNNQLYKGALPIRQAAEKQFFQMVRNIAEQVDLEDINRYIKKRSIDEMTQMARHLLFSQRAELTMSILCQQLKIKVGFAEEKIKLFERVSNALLRLRFASFAKLINAYLSTELYYFNFENLSLWNKAFARFKQQFSSGEEYSQQITLLAARLARAERESQDPEYQAHVYQIRAAFTVGLIQNIPETTSLTALTALLNELPAGQEKNRLILAILDDWKNRGGLNYADFLTIVSHVASEPDNDKYLKRFEEGAYKQYKEPVIKSLAFRKDYRRYEKEQKIKLFNPNQTKSREKATEEKIGEIGLELAKRDIDLEKMPLWEKIVTISRCFPLACPQRDRLIEESVATNHLTAEQYLEIVNLYLLPHLKMEAGYRALQLLQQREPQMGNDFTAQLAMILRCLPPSLSRDQELQRLFLQHEVSVREIVELENSHLVEAERPTSDAKKLMATSILYSLEENLKQLKAREKMEMLLYIVGIRLEKPYCLKCAALGFEADLGDARGVFERLTEMEKLRFLEILLMGEGGILVGRDKQVQEEFNHFIAQGILNDTNLTDKDKIRFAALIKTFLLKANLFKKVLFLRLLAKLDKKQAPAQLLAFIIEQLGSAFVKGGQFIAYQTTISSPELHRALIRLVDQAVPFPKKEVYQTLESEGQKGLVLGGLLGAGSMAEVLKARLAGYPDLAVKVVRPRSRKEFFTDLELVKDLLEFINAHPEYALQIPENLVPALKDFLAKELDLSTELKNYERLAAAMKSRVRLSRELIARTPAVYKELSSHSCLFMEEVKGAKLTEPQEIAKLGGNIEEIRLAIIKELLAQIEDGFYQSDPNEGGFFYNEQKEVIWVDAGSMASISAKNREIFKDLFLALYYSDVNGVLKLLVELWLEQKEETRKPLDINTLRDELQAIFKIASSKTSGELADLLERFPRLNVYTEGQPGSNIIPLIQGVLNSYGIILNDELVIFLRFLGIARHLFEGVSLEKQALLFIPFMATRFAQSRDSGRIPLAEIAAQIKRQEGTPVQPIAQTVVAPLQQKELYSVDRLEIGTKVRNRSGKIMVLASTTIAGTGVTYLLMPEENWRERLEQLASKDQQRAAKEKTLVRLENLARATRRLQGKYQAGLFQSRGASDINLEVLLKKAPSCIAKQLEQILSSTDLVPEEMLEDITKAIEVEIERQERKKEVIEREKSELINQCQKIMGSHLLSDRYEIDFGEGFVVGSRLRLFVK